MAVRNLSFGYHWCQQSGCSTGLVDVKMLANSPLTVSAVGTNFPCGTIFSLVLTSAAAPAQLLCHSNGFANENITTQPKPEIPGIEPKYALFH